jgi:DNA mismatch repair ATPase MutS
MSFIADKQTLEDLNLLGRYKSNSVFKQFDRTLTSGGGQLLEQMFREPLTDATAINERVRVFQYFGSKDVKLPFTGEAFNSMENYLRGGGSNLPETAWNILSCKVRSLLTGSDEYQLLQDGCLQTIHVLRAFRDFALRLKRDSDNPCVKQLTAVQQIFADKRLQWLETGNITLQQLIRYDHCLRWQMREEMKTLMQIIYRFDVNIAVASVAVERAYCYPKAQLPQWNELRISGLYHPLLSKAVANPATFSGGHNVMFLTGANMAGKSTYMKAFGIAVYLAHMGFPVAAEVMEFSVKDGIFSSINVPDDLEHGYSHFYAEVRRVKKVAEAVSSPQNLVVLFDELFKGTNVKDAYEATLSITAAFAAHRNCFFIVSTHIIEVGEALGERCANIRFVYMPTVMQGHIPTYTYQLKEGITADRQGMMIIENEGILQLIRQDS